MTYLEYRQQLAASVALLRSETAEATARHKARADALVIAYSTQDRTAQLADREKARQRGINELGARKWLESWDGNPSVFAKGATDCRAASVREAAQLELACELSEGRYEFKLIRPRVYDVTRIVTK